MVMQDYIIYGAFAISALPLFFLRFRKISKSYKIDLLAIKPYLWLLFLGSFYELVFSILLKIETAYWFTAYTLLEFLMLWYFFSRILRGNYKSFFYISFLLVLAAFLITLYYWSIEFHSKLEGYLYVPISLFVFACVFLYYKLLFKKTHLVPIWKTPAFYFTNGLMIYFSVGVFVSLLIYDLRIITGFFKKYWVIYIMVSYIMRIMMVIGVWKGTERK